MTLVLDTSILIDIQRERVQTIEKIKELSKSYVDLPCVAFISYFEFLYGLMEKKNKNKDVEFINMFNILPTTKTTAHLLSDLKHIYSKKGIILSLSDLLISAQVIQNNMVLVTRDRDFEKIDLLKSIIID